jgi:hypothetical protein
MATERFGAASAYRRTSPYGDWLRERGVPVFEAAGIEWRVYHSALVPIEDVPRPVDAAASEMRALLDRSGAWLVRYPGRLVDGETGPDPWYYVVCDQYVPLEKLARHVRARVRKGARTCSVRRVSAHWLAANGYACYHAAYARYRNARPISAEAFERDIRSKEAPYEHWGVFVGESLAGYSSCVVGGEWVQHAVAKYDPALLREQTAYIMVRTLMDEYVRDQHRGLTNGSRTIAHDTAYNETLQGLGFTRRYCELRVIYRPALAGLVRIVYPLRRVIMRLPARGPLGAAQTILRLEQVHRSPAPGPASTTTA